MKDEKLYKEIVDKYHAVMDRDDWPLGLRELHDEYGVDVVAQATIYGCDNDLIDPLETQASRKAKKNEEQ